MPLTPQQAQVARQLEQTAIRGGASPDRARELALVAFHESSLDPNARNKSSGAGGLLQLLSDGYVDKAEKLGGVNNPDANVNAILPDYLAYWKQHPNAPVGAAGAAVENSGEGAGWYGAGLDQIPLVDGKPTAFAGQKPQGQSSAFAEDPRQLFTAKMIQAVRDQSTAEGAQAVQGLSQPTGATQTPAAAGTRDLYPSDVPASDGGWVTISQGADRRGVATHPDVVQFVAEVAHQYGQPLTIGTGTNHSEMTADGNVSDHWTGWAADVPLTGKSLIRAGQAALVVAGADPAWAAKQTGGLYNVNGHQIIFNTHQGGDHTNHLHVSVPHK